MTDPGASLASAPEPLALWEGVGVEVEYAIVDAATLDVKPVADRLLEAALGGAPGPDGPGDVARPPLAWSNELALHVIELKTALPASGFAGLAPLFQASLDEVVALLRPLDARVLPGGMHPWMDPETELRLWPHEYTDVYRAFDRIFGCQGHGWANLQSTHVNLPFRGDEEFVRLHDAVRLVLPLIPALAASSPVLEGRVGPALDNRLRAYRENSRNVPSVIGTMVPERVRSRADYHERILGRIYADLAPHDPDGTLRHEWVNARGATARFSRGSIEVRVIDCQECIPSDLAVAAAVAGAVRAVAERGAELPDEAVLHAAFEGTIERGREAEIADPAYLEALGVDGARPLSAGAVWGALAAGVLADRTVAELHAPLRVILDRGPLAERIVGALGTTPTRAALREVYGRLCDCVERGEPFLV